MKKLFLWSPLFFLLGIGIFLFSQLQAQAIPPAEDWQGKPFPEFEGISLLDSHQHISKQDLPKEPFLVNVWASWCGWCIEEFPILHKLKAQGVPIVGVTYQDKPNDARKVLNEQGNPFSIVIDDSQYNYLTDTLRIDSAPFLYLVDEQGIIFYQHRGFNPDLEKDVLSRLSKLREQER